MASSLGTTSGGDPGLEADDALEADEVPVRIPHAESFDAFYTREYRSLAAFAYALTGSRGHAEDVAQEAMLIAYRRWDDVGQMDYPHAWVRRTCANLATSVVRRRIIEARALLRLHSRRTELAELATDDSWFWAEVRRLPRRQAQCIALKYVYGCPIAEIAAVLGCSDGAVKAYLARGRQQLADRLDQQADEESTS